MAAASDSGWNHWVRNGGVEGSDPLAPTVSISKLANCEPPRTVVVAGLRFIAFHLTVVSGFAFLRRHAAVVHSESPLSNHASKLF